ncbi:MAG: Cof-type HAD-IIB family hydrolase [bacterium]|nr:Cof-type HAD-IIB family hydrolase [bacterium]
MGRKALFFDVDGTLLSEKTRKIPESALEAIRKARKLGHMAFINSGRETCLLDEIRAMVDMDGYLCGCGTQLIVGDKTVYESRMKAEDCEFVVRNARAYGVEPVLEAQEALYFLKPPYVAKQIYQVHDSIASNHPDAVKEYKDGILFDKFCFWAEESSDTENFIRLLSSRVTVIDRGGGMYECVPLGHSKATAIHQILELYGIALEDAYVFGDSTNDLSMFQAVPNTILMGKHDKELEPYASFVTKDLEDDGIAYAMEQLGILLEENGARIQ